MSKPASDAPVEKLAADQPRPESPSQLPPSQQPLPEEPAPEYSSIYSDSLHANDPARAAPPADTRPDAQPDAPSAGKKSRSLGHRINGPSFLPGPMDRECQKAAAILRSFCKKGVYADSDNQIPSSSTPGKRSKSKSRGIVTIPPQVIQRAVGLAIFTTLRAGFHFSGSAGSGIIVSRLPDGSWSPPSGIQVLSIGTGFQFGVDMYDCVCVINTREALSSFMKQTRVSLGSDIAISAGPYGAGAALDVGAGIGSGRNKGKKAVAVGQSPDSVQTEKATASSAQGSASSVLSPVFSYVTSRGFYAGVQIDGTAIVERREANAAFYGQPVPVAQILQGKVPAPQEASLAAFMDVLAAAEARPETRSTGGSEMRYSDETTGETEDQVVQDRQRETRERLDVDAGVPPPAYVDDGSNSGILDSKRSVA